MAADLKDNRRLQLAAKETGATALLPAPAPRDWVVEWRPEAGIFAPCGVVSAPTPPLRMTATAGSRPGAPSTGRTLTAI